MQWVAVTKAVKILDTNLHGSLQCNDIPQVTLSGDAEWPKVADAVIEALLFVPTASLMRHSSSPASMAGG